MKFKIVDSKEKITTIELQKAEELIGIRLPDEYRNFLLSYNGGRPDPKVGFKFKYPVHGYEESLIHWFYGIHKGEASNLIQHFEMYESYLPQDLINIANDPGGGMILLGIKGEKRGKVYFWTVAFDPEDDYDAECKTFAYVANSFNEFLDLLYPLE